MSSIALSPRSRALYTSPISAPLALLALALSGCSSGAGGEASRSGAAALGAAESSYVSDTVLAVLEKSPSTKGQTWNVSHDNRFDSDWLVNTPAQKLWGQPVATLTYPAACTKNCDADFGLQLCTTQADCTGGGTCAALEATVRASGGQPRSMCLGHSDSLVDRVYGLVAGAQKFVDITSLTPPDGQFLAAIRNAVTLLSARANPPEVRLITAEYPIEGTVNTRTLLQTIVRDVPSSSKIRVAVGAFRSSDQPQSWNHAKIVAVDGQTALVGGHNMWSQQYLFLDPVNDTSVELHGSAAGDAHRFANLLWNYTCHNENWETWLTWSVWENEWVNGSVTDDCPAPYDLPVEEGPSTTTVISVGRLGTGIETNADQADDARLALFGSARTSLRIVQQDIGPVTVPYLGLPIGQWPTAELAAIAAALVRGVDVYIVLSDLNASAGGLPITQATYSNGWTPTDVGRHIESYMRSTPGFPTGSDLDELLCTKLHLAPFRYNTTESTWPDGVPFASHTKAVEVDSQAIYISSHNMYSADLQEFGYIVDDSRITQQWLDGYWSAVWTNSSSAAVSGPEAASCSL